MNLFRRFSGGRKAFVPHWFLMGALIVSFILIILAIVIPRLFR